MFGKHHKDEQDVSDQMQGGMNLNQDQDQQGGGYGGGDSTGQDTGYGGGQSTGGSGTDQGYGGGGQDTGYGGQSTNTGYGGQNTDSGGAQGGDSTGYGGNTDSGYGGDSTGAQGFGGGDTAVGGGQTGGDQYTDNTDAPRTQQKDSTFGGDQTDLNAGGDSNIGDTAGQTQQGNTGDDAYGSGNASGYGAAGAGAGAGAAAGGADAYGSQGQGGDGYGDSQQTVTSLSAGDSLRKGSTMTSADGQSKLVFQGDGNIVLYKGSQAVWATGTDRESVKPTVLNVQEDGNVALYGEGGKFVGWATNTGGRASGTLKLVVSNSGKLVLLTDEQCLWSSSPVEANEARDISTSSAQAAY